MAHGTAVVGRLGTPDQFKIGVFGPTVNLAARLESLTKRFGVSILVDENCAAYLREEASRLGSRMQRLGRIQPAGMTHAVAVAELTPDADQATEMLVRSQSVYDLALEAFEQGRWDEARAKLEPLTGHGPAAFLLHYIQAHPAGPPPGWNGVMVLDSK